MLIGTNSARERTKQNTKRTTTRNQKNKEKHKRNFRNKKTLSEQNIEKLAKKKTERSLL